MSSQVWRLGSIIMAWKRQTQNSTFAHAVAALSRAANGSHEMAGQQEQHTYDIRHGLRLLYSYVLALSTLACTTVAHCAHCWHGPFQDMCLALAFQGLPILKLVILGSTVRTWYRRCVPYIRDSPWHLHMVSRLTGVPWLLLQALSLQCPATKDLPAHETLIEGSRSLPRKTSAFRLQG